MWFEGEALKILQYTYLRNFGEFLLNHHRNIFIVLISQKFVVGQFRLVGEGIAPPMTLMVARALVRVSFRKQQICNGEVCFPLRCPFVPNDMSAIHVPRFKFLFVTHLCTRSYKMFLCWASDRWARRFAGNLTRINAPKQLHRNKCTRCSRNKLNDRLSLRLSDYLSRLSGYLSKQHSNQLIIQRMS